MPGALVQGARRVAVGLALDATVGRVGRVAVMPASSSARVFDPDAVPVAVREVRRPVGHDAVEQLPGRRAARRSAPSTSRRRRSTAARGAPRRSRAITASASSAESQWCRSQRSRSTPAITGCTCASWKPGTSRPPARSTTSVDGTDELAHLVVGADGGDAPAGDRDGARRRARHARGEQGSADEHRVGCAAGHARETRASSSTQSMALTTSLTTTARRRSQSSGG